MKNQDLDKIINVLNSTGSNKDYTEFNLLQYYMEEFKTKPSTLYYHENEQDFYNYDLFIESLKKDFKNFKLINEHIEYNFKLKKQIPKQQYFYLDKGYLLEISTQNSLNVSNNLTELIIDYNILLIPNYDNMNKNTEIEEKISKAFIKSKITLNNEQAYLSMITMENNELYVDDFELNFKIDKLIEPDLHYGKGFEDWHNKFLHKIKTTNKGLSLLYGKSGTGKTHYIRYLINVLSKENKKILYFSPMMVSTILDPTFINFIISWCKNLDNKNVIFLIEDAEPLLYNRNDSRNIGISNLLNLTDGLLNDLLGIQIIATFNVDLNTLDNALLRPERLIAKKEFKLLNKSEIIKLTDYLNIKLNGQMKNEMSLAEIYAINNNNEILTHNISEKKTIGF